jgi:hypothetical protein
MAAADELRIVRFDPAYRDAFRQLNLAWLTRYLIIEPIDERVLADPEGEILAPGGEILFALLGGEVVGTVALKAEAEGVFELAKRRSTIVTRAAVTDCACWKLCARSRGSVARSA